MAEELNETELVETETQSTEEVVKTETEKKFTQTEVNKLIQERVRREQVASKKTKEDFEQREVDYQTQLQGYEEVINKLIASQMEAIPESVKKLLDKLSVLERLEWLSDPKNQVGKRTVPATPEANLENKKPSEQKYRKVI